VAGRGGGLLRRRAHRCGRAAGAGAVVLAGDRPVRRHRPDRAGRGQRHHGRRRGPARAAAGRRGDRRGPVGRGAASWLPGGRARRARRVGVDRQHRRREPQAHQSPVSGVAARRDQPGRHPGTGRRRAPGADAARRRGRFRARQPAPGAGGGAAARRRPGRGEPGQDPRHGHVLPVADERAQPGPEDVQRRRRAHAAGGADRVAGAVAPGNAAAAARAATRSARRDAARRHLPGPGHRRGAELGAGPGAGAAGVAGGAARGGARARGPPCGGSWFRAGRARWCSARGCRAGAAPGGSRPARRTRAGRRR